MTFLKLCEIEKQDGEGLLAALSVGKSALDRSLSSARFCEVGEGVRGRLVRELLFERLALADVPAVQHHLADVRVVEHVVAMVSRWSHEPSRCWTALDPARDAWAHRGAKKASARGNVFRVEELGQLHADETRRGHSRGRARRRVVW